MSFGIAGSYRSGGRLATPLANCYFHHSFLHFHFSTSSPSQPILIEWLLWKTYLIKVDRSAKNWKTNPIPDPISHFVAPWRPFWIIEVLIEGMIKSKNCAQQHMANIHQDGNSIRNIQVVSSNRVHSTHLCEANKCRIFKPFFFVYQIKGV